MVTNSYKPVIGGLERSVELFSSQYRKRKHRTMILAPEFEKTPKNEKFVLRVPAIKNVTDHDLSIHLPMPEGIRERLDRFRPEVIHSHQPFLLGDTALRLGVRYNAPVVFTMHTIYNEGTHFSVKLPLDLKKLFMKGSVGYANLCDRVFVPSRSVGALLEKCRRPVEVVPTGVEKEKFRKGDGQGVREQCGITSGDFVLGFISRIAPEKNIDFLAAAAAEFLKRHPQAHFLLGGGGSSADKLRRFFAEQGLEKRVHFLGVLKGQRLIDAYHAMDVFVFASHTETQGLVLLEAMAAGKPVVGVKASGVEDVIDDFKNGRLILEDSVEDFVDGIEWVYRLSPEGRKKAGRHIEQTVDAFSVDKTVEKALDAYRAALEHRKEKKGRAWHEAVESLKVEGRLFYNKIKAVTAAAESEDA